MEHLQPEGAEGTFDYHQEAPWVPATFMRRAVAFLVDLPFQFGLLFLAALLEGTIVYGLQCAGLIDRGWFGRRRPFDGNSLLVSSLFYNTVCVAMGGATFGKRALGLRVLSLKGAICTPWQGLGRSVTFYLDSLLFGLVGYSSMRGSRLRQRYGDRWAGTAVVSAKQSSLAPAPALGIVAGGLAFVAIATVFFLLPA